MRHLPNGITVRILHLYSVEHADVDNDHDHQEIYRIVENGQKLGASNATPKELATQRKLAKTDQVDKFMSAQRMKSYK